jgi:hypothetical protein
MLWRARFLLFSDITWDALARSLPTKRQPPRGRGRPRTRFEHAIALALDARARR